jgi:AcrR family transcriptional regulator
VAEPARRVTARSPGTAPRRPLRPETIVATALTIAGRGHLADVGMVSVANRLGVTPMALYRHVGDKENLLRLVVDAAHRDLAFPGPEVGDWAVRMRTLVRDLRAIYRRYPGLAEYSAAHAPVLRTEHAMAVADWCLDLLLQAGVDEDDVGLVYPAVRNLFFVGLVRRPAPEVAPEPAEVDTSRYPSLARMLPRILAVSADAQFEFLFDLYIDWIGDHIAARTEP